MGGRLERQEGRLGRQEPRIVGFADSSSEIVGFAQSAGKRRRQAGGPRLPKLPRRQAELDNFCMDFLDTAPTCSPVRPEVSRGIPEISLAFPGLPRSHLLASRTT